MKIALTGVTGNMGQQTIYHLLKLNNIENLKLLVLPDDKRINKILKKYKKFKQIIEVIYGDIKDKSTCKELVANVDYVINLASVIPPHSDQFPQKAVECNQIGVNSLVSEIEALETQPKLIHISTVALYGNRNYLHPWGRVGDPLLVSPFDIYSATKLRGEYRVIESNITNWVVLRQTAMLHKNMLSDNMNDGLMFHTCFNAPLEWATAYDSGLLLANILKQDLEQDLSKVFWKKVFNIGGGEYNRNTGYDTLNDGFKLIGGTTKDFFKPYYNASRNFHGIWFYDGAKLNELFHYQTQNIQDYWRQIKKSHKIYGIAKILPKSMISKIAIQRLFNNANSPAYWYKHNDTAKLIAYFDGKQNYENIPQDWSKFDLLIENKVDNNNVDYNALKNINNAQLIDLGYDYSKLDQDITIEDLKNVAKMHGGRLLSKSYNGDLYEKLEWYTQDNERFLASPYAILRAGHWYNKTYEQNVWDFDRLSKKDKVYAQLWLDSHKKEENFFYYLDKNFIAKIKGKTK